MSSNGQSLFDLLPALYRLRDAQLAQSAPGPLQSLLMLIEEQLAVVAEDLDQLYDNQFIETCAPWVVPYIGDLIGYQPVHGVASAVASPRAEVAHTISFRRRKGTVLVLEQLARDVTGWGAHAVEFFKVLATTQYMNHIRPHNHYAPNLRRWQPRAYMNTGFDATAHTVDVRRIAVERGRYNIPNIGIFLWSLNAYSLTASPAVAAAGNTCFRFSSLGRDIPLFNHPVSQGSEITAPARPVNVPDVLLRPVLCSDIRQTLAADPAALNYDPGNSLALYIDGSLVVPSKIQVCDLSGDDGSWNNQPPAGSPFAAAIDPELGRIAVPPPGPAHSLTATFYYGFNADMGGGEYPRADTFAASPEQAVVRVPARLSDYPRGPGHAPRRRRRGDHRQRTLRGTRGPRRGGEGQWTHRAPGRRRVPPHFGFGRSNLRNRRGREPVRSERPRGHIRSAFHGRSSSAGPCPRDGWRVEPAELAWD